MFDLRPLFFPYIGLQYPIFYIVQKQSSRSVLRESYSENMQQIYRRTSMRKCDFNKVAKQNHTSAWVFSRKFVGCVCLSALYFLSCCLLSFSSDFLCLLSTFSFCFCPLRCLLPFFLGFFLLPFFLFFFLC